MIVHRVDGFPPNYNPYSTDLDELDDYELNILAETYGIDECWYWYATAPYEGSGYILMRRGNQWDFDDLGHCSCYGPMENVHFTSQGNTINEMLDSITKEAQQDILNLVVVAMTQMGSNKPPLEKEFHFKAEVHTHKHGVKSND
jgi:uncharacterized membrane-anchored protein